MLILLTMFISFSVYFYDGKIGTFFLKNVQKLATESKADLNKRSPESKKQIELPQSDNQQSLSIQNDDIETDTNLLEISKNLN